jgi:hypothetical protein
VKTVSQVNYSQLIDPMKPLSGDFDLELSNG